MKVKVYGKVTKQVYAVGQKWDCLRMLQQDFPDFRRGIKKDIVNDPIYKEPLVIEPIR